MKRLKPCISHRKSQTLSMLDMLWLPLSLKMGKFSRAFVWAERAALFNMYQETGQNKVRRIIAFRDQPPHGGPSGMPCGACREFLMELHPDNRNLEFMVDYETRQTITLGELLPLWWGEERAQQFEEKSQDKA